MATTITAATLTVTHTEEVTLNGYDQGSKNILTIDSVTAIADTAAVDLEIFIAST